MVKSSISSTSILRRMCIILGSTSVALSSVMFQHLEMWTSSQRKAIVYVVVMVIVVMIAIRALIVVSVIDISD